MAKISIEGYTKFVKEFTTAKGTAYSGLITNGVKDEESGEWANADIPFVYFGYDNEIQDKTLINIKGMTDVDNYNPENPRLKVVAFEMLPLSGGGKENNKTMKKVDKDTKDENPYG